MPIWNRNKVSPSNLNNGNEYTVGDQPTEATFNDANNNAFYAVDFVEGLVETPDNSQAATVGVPSVSLVPYQKVIDGVTKTFYRFKFANLKGDSGTGATVVQGLGNSTTDVPSQKAVTDALNEKAQRIEISYTITRNAWLPVSGYYYAVMGNSSILATDEPHIAPVLDTTNLAASMPIKKAWSSVFYAEARAGSIYFYATEQPSVDIPIQIEVLR